MDLKKASTGEGYAMKIGTLGKERLKPMSPVDSKQMKPAARSPLDPHGNRLNTWKEIAVYLDREVRTVQRWEKREGLPVRRHFHVNGGTVYAFKKEIDAWLRSRRQAPSEPALKKECSEHGTEWLNPTLLAVRRMPRRSRSWLQNAAAGVGSVDLLQGENRIRLYFYLQLQGEQDANPSARNSVNRGRV